MQYYYFELYVNSKVYYRKMFTSDSEEIARKYVSYKEQALREVKQLNQVVTSEFFIMKLDNITSKEVNDIENLLLDMSEYRGKMVETIRLLNTF